MKSQRPQHSTGAPQHRRERASGQQDGAGEAERGRLERGAAGRQTGTSMDSHEPKREHFVIRMHRTFLF